MKSKVFIEVDLKDETHCSQLLKLLNDYMEDEMGINESMPENLGPRIIEGLKKHPAYLGFFVCIENDFAGLANCNLNYSTWQSKYIINIHDFIVSPNHREQGVGFFLLNEIENYAKEKGYCRINLEVRNDNVKAQNLYKKAGFIEGQPPMYFWEKKIG